MLQSSVFSPKTFPHQLYLLKNVNYLKLFFLFPCSEEGLYRHNVFFAVFCYTLISFKSNVYV